MKLLMKITHLKFTVIQRSTKNQSRVIKILEYQIPTDFYALKYFKNKAVIKIMANL